MLISALYSTMGTDNPLTLGSKRSVCVILVDGLGTVNLKAAGAHASFLNSQRTEQAMCWFPATTATSIAAFGTASDPCTNGFLGYQVLHRPTDTQLNLLSGWADYEAGMHYQELETIAEMALAQGIDFETIAPRAYERSGFTAATMRGSNFRGVDSIAERFELAGKLLRESNNRVIYLYIPELDQIAHAFGTSSTRWLNHLEDIDSLLQNFIAKTPKSAGVILTADHGVVDIDQANHIYLDEFISADALRYIGGDTRSLFVYLKKLEDISNVKKSLQDQLGESCYVLEPEDLIVAGYWKELGAKSLEVSPDFLILAKKKVALFHRDFAKPKSLLMVGHHGSISHDELSIPIIKFGF